MVYNQFTKDLQQAFMHPLPGKPAQDILKPYLRIYKSMDAPQLPNAKEGAVMSLIYPINNIPHILFIERPVYAGVHSGQIAFPGGKIEKNDNSILDAALRETKEEIGVNREQIEVIGPLSQVYVLASNFIVYPFVGILQEKPIIIPDKLEVANTLEVPMYKFFEQGIIKEKVMKSAMGINLNAPYYDIGGKILWGATAMMVSELCAVIKNQGIKLY
ncbi:MAG TPA: CoA pyrophosphatase [Chitinophagales bacterium]|nr:CoA pyrophosphatase [Chitinophagales bacterium]HQG38984.1 CoA pyrophosphatase [Chitinophagales bacterium]